MSHGNLATLNNNAAAKTARDRKTPYVPWNIDEVREPGFIGRIPFIGAADPDGWLRVSVEKAARPLTNIENWLSIEKEPVGFGWIPADGGIYTLGVYKPLPEAHQPLQSEGPRPVRR